MMQKVKAILKLTRVEHGVMVSLAILVGALIVKGLKVSDEELTRVAIGSVVGLFVEMGVFGFNDYFNVEEDKINSPDRPLVRGDLSLREALILSSVFLGVGILLPWCVPFRLPLNSTILLYSVVMLDMGYNTFLKKYGPIGNLAVSLSTAVPFIYGALLVVELSEIPLHLWIFFLIAFLATFSREVIKDVRDAPGDLKAGLITLPHIIGIGMCYRVASYLMVTAVLLSLIAAFLVKNKIAYLTVVSLADFILLYSLVTLRKTEKLQFKETLDKFRRLSLIGMAIGIIAFLVSSL